MSGAASLSHNGMNSIGLAGLTGMNKFTETSQTDNNSLEKEAEMNLPSNVLNMAYRLAKDVEKQIKPHSFIFEPTKKGSSYHYKVCRHEVCPGKREKVIAWANVYKKKPRLVVSIICDLLGIAPIVSKLVRRRNASWGETGRDECQGVTYKVNDQGYHVLLDALVVAAKGWLRHC